MSSANTRSRRNTALPKSIGGLWRLSRVKGRYEQLSMTSSPSNQSLEHLIQVNSVDTVAGGGYREGLESDKRSFSTYKVMLSSSSAVAKAAAAAMLESRTIPAVPAAGGSKLQQLRAKMFGTQPPASSTTATAQANGKRDNPLFEHAATDDGSTTDGMSSCGNPNLSNTVSSSESTPLAAHVPPSSTSPASFARKLFPQGSSRLRERSGSLQIAALRPGSTANTGNDKPKPAGARGPPGREAGGELLQAVRDLCSLRDQLHHLTKDQKDLKDQVQCCLHAVDGVQRQLTQRAVPATEQERLETAEAQLSALQRDLELAKQIVRQQDGQVEALTGSIEARDAHIDALHRQIEKMEVWALALQEEYDLARTELMLHQEAEAVRMAAEEEALQRMHELDMHVCASLGSAVTGTSCEEQLLLSGSNPPLRWSEAPSTTTSAAVILDFSPSCTPHKSPPGMDSGAASLLGNVHAGQLGETAGSRGNIAARGMGRAGGDAYDRMQKQLTPIRLTPQREWLERVAAARSAPSSRVLTQQGSLDAARDGASVAPVQPSACRSLAAQMWSQQQQGAEVTDRQGESAGNPSNGTGSAGGEGADECRVGQPGWLQQQQAELDVLTQLQLQITSTFSREAKPAGH